MSVCVSECECVCVSECECVCVCVSEWGGVVHQSSSTDVTSAI